MLKVVIFDLDGVLIETELETFKFYQKRLKNFGIELSDEAFRYKAGRKSRDFFHDALTQEDRSRVDVEKLLSEKRELFNTEITRYAKEVPGGKKLLQWLIDNGFVLALASQNETRMINSALNWLGIKDYFEIILSLDDIENKKPHPEIYELACSRLKYSKEECLVVEDSKDGVMAAKNAGMMCVQIQHSYMPHEILNLGDVTVKSLDEIKSFLQNKKREGFPDRQNEPAGNP